MLNISLCGNQIAGSPFAIDVVDPSTPPKCDASKVVAVGSGLSEAQLGKLSEFIVDGCSDCKAFVINWRFLHLLDFIIAFYKILHLNELIYKH